MILLLQIVKEGTGQKSGTTETFFKKKKKRKEKSKTFSALCLKIRLQY